jgi:hypothetical protein
MKEKKTIVALLLIAVMLLSLIPSGIYSADTTYTGMPDGAAIIKNASFTDIAGSANRDYILRMAAYSVINEYGNTKYRPKDYATRQEVLAALVRVVGKQQAANTVGEALKSQNPALSTVDAYLRGHIEEAKTAGIITDPELLSLSALTRPELAAIQDEVAAAARKNWKMTKTEKEAMQKTLEDQRSYDKAMKTAATREEVALWTARTLGLTPVTGEKTMGLYGYKDWKSIATANVPYLEAVNRSGILKGETSDSYVPKGKIKREDLAVILSRAADSSLPALGLTTGFGRILSKAVSKDASAFSQGAATTDIKLQTPEGPTLNLQAVSQAAAGKNQSIPVIKNGKIGSQDSLQEGDIVEYTLTADNRTLLLQVGKYKELQGNFISYSPALGSLQMEDKNSKKYQFLLSPDTVTTAQNTPIDISKAEGTVPATAIYQGNILKSINLDVSPDKINNQNLAVTILFADPLGKVLKVEDEAMNRRYLQLSEDASIYINDELKGIEAIGFDQAAVLKVADNQVLEVRVYTDLPEEEEPYTRIITGRVREVSGNNLFISPDEEPDKQSSYILGSTVPIIKDKQSVNKYKLQPGDRVKLYVDSAMGDYVSRVEVQSSGIKITGIYKGDIKEVLPSTGQIILSNVYTYGYNDWVKKGDYIKYKLAGEAQLYNGNSRIDINKLKDSIGSTLYMVSKEDYGNEEIVHGLLKNGYEDSTYKGINDVKYTAGQLTLSDGRILDYQQGSIVIQGGKLMDTGDLKKNTSAFVIQNKAQSGARTAAIISLDSFSGIGGYTISKGYLHNMGEDYFTMETGHKLVNNTWVGFKENTYQLSDDTYIYDNILKHGVITADKLAESRFKPYTYTWPNYALSNYGKEYHEDDKYHSEYKDNHYSGYYHEHSLLYTVADQYGNAVGINLYTKDKEQFSPDRKNNERMTSGQVEKIDSANSILTIGKAMEFSPLYQEWRPTAASLPMDTEKAVVLRDGKPVSLKDLAVGDSVYAVAVNGMAVLIIAE